MKKVLIAYASRTGTTEKMADYLAEGIRMSGNEAKAVKISLLKKDEDFAGFDGFAIGHIIKI